MVATGEQVTTGLLAIALQQSGVEARSWQGWQIPIRTDDAHGKARIADIEGAELIRRMQAGQVAVVAGFQGLGPTTASPRWAAAARIPRRSRWRRR